MILFNSEKMKRFFFCILVFTITLCKAQEPKDYSCNPYVKYSVDSTHGQYKISYTFQDNFNLYRTFTWYYDIAQTKKDIARFGVPVSYYENISSHDTMGKQRKQMIKHGFFMQSGQYLKPDRSAVISFYKPYCKAIAGGITNLLIEENRNSRINRIKMAISFVQDIPYGVPEIKDSTWEVYGLFTPPELLLKMFGDCDSKAILLSCILSYLINTNDILLLYQGHNHALVAIKGEPSPQQKYIEIENKKFIIADVTGPLKLAWGDDGDKFDSAVGYKVEKLRVRSYWFR